MANIQRNFIRGRMNKSLDERLVPNGEYIDALNVRLGSTEESEIGSVENSKGNSKITSIQYIDGTALSTSARCIGAYEDGANQTVYWFIHDSNFSVGATGKLDLIVSLNVNTGSLIYHVISIDDGNGGNTTLNFNGQYLITGVDKINDLLFFTDNLNAPRVININQSYSTPVSNIDQFNEDEILVVKKPPVEAPTISTFSIAVSDAWLEERFVCFAYRYKYANDEYSATSQFSEPSFIPGSFQFSANSYLNEGMVNSTNACSITFNTGDALVKEIQLLFKEADNTTIKIVETYNKNQLGLNNNINHTVQFTNRKIFTLLPSSEILRLYDNVPQKAKAQTIMGNRLVYGNYVDGHNLTDIYGSPLNLSYTTELVSETISTTELPTTVSKGNYTIGGGIGIPAIEIDDSVLNIDFAGQVNSLKKNTRIEITFGFTHAAFQVPTLDPTPAVPSATHFIVWNYTLQKDYSSVYELATDSDFVEKIGTSTSLGTAGTIQTVSYQQPNASLGFTLTDIVNAATPQVLDSTYSLDNTGISTNTVIPNVASPSTVRGEAIEIIPPTQTGTVIGLQILAGVYQVGGYTDTAYEYFRIVNENVTFQDVNNIASLHSNRNYELGIVYMDGYNRSSTALVSTNNTLNIPCNKSASRNTIKAFIPTNQIAPAWATRYKFVLKPSATTYQTIYSNISFIDESDGTAFYLLEGENGAKVEAGDRLVVKRDNQGVVNSCAYATVLEKETKAAGFLTAQTSGGDDIDVPGGTYMKINPSNFAAANSILSIVSEQVPNANAGVQDNYPIMAYPFYTTTRDATGTPTAYTVYDVPVGTQIVMTIKFTRNGGRHLNSSCDRRNYTLEKTLTSSRDYDSMADWFEGDNIGDILDDGVKDLNPDTQTMNNTELAKRTAGGAPLAAVTVPYDLADVQAVLGAGATTPNTTNYYTLYEDNTTNAAGPNLPYLLISGSRACGNTDNFSSIIECQFEVYRSNSLTVFETIAEEALEDTWYENNESFGISATGLHLGNVQDQSSTIPAVINTNFFNCFAFGNGVESYRVRDSIQGKSFNLGNRVFTTSNVNYQEAHRFADLTYSGVYNDESNVNKLNEFNLGLLNFKTLEDSFGDVEILYARETDILVLQEDKISYVLAGKNLLSDAVGGGTVTSVPEVLGTQIARIENYGISNHPESFVAWGENKYFSDAKRSAVVNLIGSSANDEQLVIISQSGMRSWFRDLFTDAMTTQKLGGFDPYMNEYIFTSNTILKPEVSACLACDVTKNITVIASQTFVYCVDVTQQTGTVTVDYVIPFENTDDIVTESTSQNIVTEGGDDIITEGQSSGTGYYISSNYNGSVTSVGPVYQSGSFTFDKNSVTADQVVISIYTDSTLNDTIQVNVSCPAAPQLSVYSVCVTSANNAGKFIHNEFNWTSGTTNSPTQSELVTFSSNTVEPIVSQYAVVTGGQGGNIIPPDGATVSIICNKFNFDDFVFDTTANKFMYLRTDVVYENTSTGINSLLSAAITPATDTTGAPQIYEAEFVLPAGGSNLYLIYDYRSSASQQLCYSDVNIEDSCCNCTFPTPTPTPTPTPSPTPTPIPSYNYYEATDCDGGNLVYLKSNTTLGSFTVNDVVQYNDGASTNNCATITQAAGAGIDGEVVVQVTGCGDSRCAIP